MKRPRVLKEKEYLMDYYSERDFERLEDNGIIKISDNLKLSYLLSNFKLKEDSSSSINLQDEHLHYDTISETSTKKCTKRRLSESSGRNNESLSGKSTSSENSTEEFLKLNNEGKSTSEEVNNLLKRKRRPISPASTRRESPLHNNKK